MNQSSQTTASTISFALTRVVVPFWVLAGATFKLVEANPANLPKQIWRVAFNNGIDLDWLLVTLISIEFLFVAVMVFIARLARPAAILLLSTFCLVLLNELRTGNFVSCGCLGNIPIKPWQMLAIDGVLLLGVIVTGLMAIPKIGKPWRYGMAAAALFTLVGTAAAIAQIIPDRRPDVIVSNGDATNIPTPVSNPDVAPPVSPIGVDAPPTIPAFTPARPPKTYVTPDDKSIWIGKPWKEIELLQYLPQEPKDINQGTRYVVFYSRSCDHCEQMFWNDLIMPIGEMVTAVEMPGTQVWEMPATKCEMLTLPTGTNWIITPPLAFKIVDGIVQCANEGDHKACLDLQ